MSAGNTGGSVPSFLQFSSAFLATSVTSFVDIIPLELPWCCSDDDNEVDDDDTKLWTLLRGADAQTL